MNANDEPQPESADATPKPVRRLPEWLKLPLPTGHDYAEIEELLKRHRLNTVCRSAGCPNLGQCWSRGVATFMILGNTCTRNCRFCAVDKGRPEPVDVEEPMHVADASAQLKLRHVVVTSVTRDDLPDEGAGHFAETIRCIRERLPESTIEVLVPDFHAKPELMDIVCAARPDVYNHNLETVRELAPTIRPMADYARSLDVMRYVSTHHCECVAKSGLMIGLGEDEDQIRRAMRDLAEAGCRLITIGQYLAPSKSHFPVQRFYTPEEFAAFETWAKENLPEVTVAASPFVRSSYLADEVFDRHKSC